MFLFRKENGTSFLQLIFKKQSLYYMSMCVCFLSVRPVAAQESGIVNDVISGDISQALLESDSLSSVSEEKIDELEATALSSDPGSSEIESRREESIERSLELATLCQYEDSIAIMRELIEAYPQDIELKIRLAQIYGWKRDFESSLYIYRKLLENNPRSIEIRLGIAEVLSWQGQLSAARNQYNTVTTIDPGNVEALIGLAQVLDWQGEHDKAIDQYQIIIQSAEGIENQPPISARIGLAKAIASKGDYALAISLFEDVLDKDPDNADAQLGLAEAYIDIDRIQPALELIDSADTYGCNTEAQNLLYEIRSVETESRFTSAENGVSGRIDESKFSTSQTAKFRINDSNTTQFIRVERHHFQQSGLRDITLIPVEVGVSGHLGFAKWDGSVGATFSDRSQTSPIVRSSITWPVTANFDIGLSADWDRYRNNVATIENDIRRIRITPSLFWEIDSETNLVGNYQHGWLSDGNQEDRVYVALERSFSDFFIYTDMFYWQFANNSDQGYFSPESLFYYGFLLGWDGSVTDILDCRLAAGMKFQNISEARSTSARYSASCTAEIDRYTDFIFKYSSDSDLYQRNNLFPFRDSIFSAELRFRL